MRLLFVFLLAILYGSCQTTPTKLDASFSYQPFQWLEDSVAAWKVQWEAEQETKAVDSTEEELILFLGLLPPKTAALQAGDTLITLLHDYSFAGFIGAKYTQIFKTTTSLQLTQVAYENYKDREDSRREGLTLRNPLTGMNFGKVYPTHYKQKDLTLAQWDSLTTNLQASQFLAMGKEDCGRLVLDGTYTYIVFHTLTHTHKVSRHDCPAPIFYQLAQQIDSLSPDPIQF